MQLAIFTLASLFLTFSLSLIEASKHPIDLNPPYLHYPRDVGNLKIRWLPGDHEVTRTEKGMLSALVDFEETQISNVIALEKYQRSQYKAHLDDFSSGNPRIVGYIAWDAYLTGCHVPGKLFGGSSPKRGAHCDLRIIIRMIAGRGHGLKLWRVLLRWVALTVPRLEVKVDDILVSLYSVRGPRELRFYEKIGFQVSAGVWGFGNRSKPTQFKPMFGSDLILLERELPVPRS